MTEEFETGGAVLSRTQVNVVRLTGLAGIIGGILLIVVAVVAWVGVSSQLRAENIVIPDDAPIFAGKVVDGPIDAYVQAGVIDMHARDMADGKTYSELDQDDPLRTTVMNASFLRASLFTSVIAFGIALFAGGVGVLFLLFGWSLRVLVPPLPKR
ncbi:aromatic ring-opening dioxygenase LigA [Agromyces sp. H3Y2-19a]|uniref:aromatic ring-opening dioxygenase LigA n=1 Tax=Agromyces TaxID=33877 RepID=UPI001E5D1E8A|nr:MULTISPECIES: aromatic ring-opening dioxygenase LigA [Agromyces]MCD5345631.1 aromatic ring-opening dioxygenase LigA [Agromyces sp. S2-1-8]MDF0511997.1 aromatic ring-opening dioxygenase LigA [Agromyces chromiiresistens]